MTKQEQYALADAVARLEALVDPTKTDGTDDPKVKAAIKLYLESWVAPYVLMALRNSLGLKSYLGTIYGRGGCKDRGGAAILAQLRREKAEKTNLESP